VSQAGGLYLAGLLMNEAVLNHRGDLSGAKLPSQAIPIERLKSGCFQ
jgi:hypothetical protein